MDISVSRCKIFVHHKFCYQRPSGAHREVPCKVAPGRKMEINQTIPSALGSFNNYMDKKRWVGSQQKVHAFHINKGKVVCKMSTIVQSMGWSKSGKLWSTQLQNDPSPRRSASDPRFGIQHVFPLNYEAERITQVNQSNTYS